MALFALANGLVKDFQWFEDNAMAETLSVEPDSP